jgi:hypothetical protein
MRLGADKEGERIDQEKVKMISKRGGVAVTTLTLSCSSKIIGYLYPQRVSPSLGGGGGVG